MWMDRDIMISIACVESNFCRTFRQVSCGSGPAPIWSKVSLKLRSSTGLGAPLTKLFTGLHWDLIRLHCKAAPVVSAL